MIKVSNLLNRVLVATILLPTFLITLYFGSWIFAICIGIIVLAASIEFMLFFKSYFSLIDFIFVFIFSSLIIVGFYFNIELYKILIVYFTFIILDIVFRGKVEDSQKILVESFVLFYIALMGGITLKFRMSIDNLWIISFPFLNTWVFDTFAYIGGTLIGKHKLAVLISPKKTVEGLIIGIIGALILSFIYYVADKNINYIFISPVLSILATGGDLLESMFKRSKGRKDASFLLGAHGGVLDRIDSLLIVVPFFFLVIENGLFFVGG